MSTATVTATVKLWEEFPFNYANKRFISKVSVNSSKLETIVNLSAGIFASLNEQCLAELSTINASTTREHDLAELERLNAGAHWAIVELAGE